MIRKLIASSLLVSGLALGTTTASLAAPPDVSSQRVAAEQAVDNLAQVAPSTQALWSDQRGAPTFISGINLAVSGDTPREQAESFLAEWSESVAGVALADLYYMGTEQIAGRVSVRFQQVHQGLPVTGRFVVVTLTEDSRVLSLSNDAVVIDVAKAGNLDEDDARSIAFQAVHPEWVQANLDVHVDAPQTERVLRAIPLTNDMATSTRATRVILADVGGAVVVWKVHVESHPLLRNATVWVDTQNGQVVGLRNNVQH